MSVVPRLGLPRTAKQRWLVWGLIAVVALALAVIAATVVVPWYTDGRREPARSPLAAGRAHTCAITPAGGVKCWGDNAYGQLGNGTMEPSATPVDVVGLSAGVVSLSGTGNHTCAVTDAGAARCWGDNASGQLGNNGVDPSPVPVDVAGLEAGVLTVSASASHTCALTGSRAVACWGENGSSQLGTGDAVNRSAPAEVAGLPARSTDVTVGNGFTCVVFTGRTVRCWGDNGDGQLGLGDTQPRLSWVPVGELPRTASVSAGDTHTCALSHEGEVLCWGANGAGQLGLPLDTSTSPRPVAVPGLGRAGSVAAGYQQSCALADGTVTCWGGLVGEADPATAAPRAIAGVEGADGVAVGAFHACAASPAGVWCWGTNSSGQLGDGTTTDSAAAVQVVGF